MNRTLLCLLVFVIGSPVSGEVIAVRADFVYTSTATGRIEKGVVLIRDGRIEAVGMDGEITIPADARVLSASVVTPGFIDAQSTVGVSGIFSVDADQDQDEYTGANQADLRTLDGFNPAEELLEYLMKLGVTCAHVGPAQGNPIAGQSAVVKTVGRTIEEMTVKAPAALMFNLGEPPKKTYGSRNQTPGTRMGTAAVIRKALVEAQAYARKWEEYNAPPEIESATQAESGETEDKKPKKKTPPDRDLKKDALMACLAGEMPALFCANREDDILTALRIAEEFRLEPTLSGASDGYLVREEIKQSGTSVIVHPTMQRLSDLELMNSSIENAALLADRGIPVAFQSGFESYVPKTRVVLFEAAVAAANGLGFGRALAGLTIDAARILGVEDRVGSIEPGKDADLVLFDGDPFEYTSHIEAVLINGVVTYER